MSGSEQENQIESLLSLFLMNDFRCTFALRNRFTLVTEGNLYMYHHKTKKMGRRKTTLSDNALEMIISINQRLTELVNCDIPKRLHCIEEKLDYINPKLLTIEHIDRFYSEVKTVLTVTEACEYMGITESHMYKLTSNGKIPHYKPTGKLIYFDRSELDDWLLQNKTYNEISNDNENK